MPRNATRAVIDEIEIGLVRISSECYLGACDHVEGGRVYRIGEIVDYVIALITSEDSFDVVGVTICFGRPGNHLSCQQE